MILQLRSVHLSLRVECGVLVKVGEEDCLRVRGLDMFSGAAVTMAAGADFVVERAVDFVLFSPEDGGEIVGHDEVQTLGLEGVLDC